MEKLVTHKRLTFTSAGDFVSEHVDLVNSAELGEHLGQLCLVHGVRHLAHEHLDEVGVGLVVADVHASETNAKS